MNGVKYHVTLTETEKHQLWDMLNYYTLDSIHSSTSPKRADFLRYSQRVL